FSSPNLRVSTRIEAYSCKAIARERKLYKTLEHDLLSDLTLSTSISPPEHHHSLINSAFGPLDRKSSRKTLWLLIATLNIAFSDHDFSTLSAEEFVKEENPRIVLASLTSALSHLRSSNGQDTTPAMPLVLDGYGRTNPPISHTMLLTKLRNELDGTYEVPTNLLLKQVLDPIIDLNECEVYSYTPDLDSDPHAYQSEDEEEEEDEDSEGDDADEMGAAGGGAGYDDAGRHSDGLDMDLDDDEDDSNPYYTTATSMQKMQADAMQWEMDGLENDNDEADNGGLLWSSNYFFYNRKMKRILFVSCWGR
ncbi:Maf1 regulator, partial [Cystobasidium minutum MCA 4210]|uniref:Maf1 regulator n=1 Tax=Cystobasidium minutum MCA 4210 TaxID=1397322 RepID=UPI0034CF4AFD